MKFFAKLSIFLSIFLLLSVVGFSSALTKVSLQILKDIYVLPVAELATTKTHPEIIKIENNLIEVTIIPNRGRVIASYALKKQGEKIPLLYNELNPSPMVLPEGLHTVEFGGYYLSLPWNERDRQPFDLSFEIKQNTENLAEVYLSGKDIFKKTLTECWIRVRNDSPLAEIATKITNTSKRKEITLDFKDFTVVNSMGECRWLLPIEKVEVLESEDNWLGEPGTVLASLSEINEWNKAEKYFRVLTKDRLSLPLAAFLYSKENVAFIKLWGPQDFFTKAEVWSWGKSYPEKPGANAYVVLSNVSEGLTLKPQQEISFKVYLIALDHILQEELGVLFKKAKSYLAN
ncbi:hypothetical protein QBE54_07645 [Thermatribacter velox]|uniref:Uncharacterized protein n=1 Tax=Thermatribacter velox TaxID=3039681 RepID=A0ABZ2YB21_9BACT